MQKPIYTIALVTALQAIQKIADNYNLRVIYDAAHAFGVKDKSGAIICPDARTKIFRHRQHRLRHCERSAAIHPPTPRHCDCRVALLLAMTKKIPVIASVARQSIPRSASAKTIYKISLQPMYNMHK